MVLAIIGTPDDASVCVCFLHNIYIYNFTFRYARRQGNFIQRAARVVLLGERKVVVVVGVRGGAGVERWSSSEGQTEAQGEAALTPHVAGAHA